MAKRPGELTEDLKSQRYETFAVHYFQTGDREASMIAAGYSPLYAKENAPKVLNNTKVQKRLSELRQAAQDKAIGTVVERQQILTSIYRTDESAKHRISAISEHNKMTGVYDTKTTINNININAVQIEDTQAGGKFREVIDAVELKSED